MEISSRALRRQSVTYWVGIGLSVPVKMTATPSRGGNWEYEVSLKVAGVEKWYGTRLTP